MSDGYTDADLGTLRRLRRGHWEPTRERPGREATERYTHREFEGSTIAELFHEATKYSRRRPTAGTSAGRFVSEDAFALAQSRIPPAKPAVDRTALPDPVDLSVPVDEVLLSRRSRRTFGREALSLAELGTLLGLGCGVSARREVAPGVDHALRTYPSAGALYPVNAYLLALQDAGEVGSGLYWYDPTEHVLGKQREGEADLADEIDAAFAPAAETFDVWNAAAVVVLAGAFGRSTAKYGDLGYRFVLQESGHVAGNLLAVATALDLAAFPSAAYDDRALDDLLGVDGVDESTVYTVPVGPRPEDEDD
ncbi:hypothetical protein BRC83_03590 [Halobacteriales archaeon QS_1_68_17]|nr:MAG: hypothetical protein BRC83_03590 [Halobacteriales archaeon QS_1_68_17]